MVPPRQADGQGLALAEVMALPAVTNLVTAGKALGIGRSKSYELARAGKFPCQVIRIGTTYRVLTVGLLTLLGLSPPSVTLPQAADHHREDRAGEAAKGASDPGFPRPSATGRPCSPASRQPRTRRRVKRS
jgi:predicted DNA-binding transcriptional regulator AlpA